MFLTGRVTVWFILHISAVCGVLVGCNTFDEYIAPSANEDDSDLADARARWEAYDLKNYTIDQTRTAEGFPAFTFAVIVRDGSVADVLYEEPWHIPGGRSPEAFREEVMSTAMTVEEAFALLEHEKSGAAQFQVEYDAKYGFPTEIFIDPDAQMTDDEIIRAMSNLKK